MTAQKRGPGPHRTAMRLALAAATEVEQAVLAGQALGYTEAEARNIVRERIERVTAHPRCTYRDALDQARLYFQTVTPEQHRQVRLFAPVTPPGLQYLGWPLHNWSFAAEASHLSVATRLLLDQLWVYRAP